MLLLILIGCLIVVWLTGCVVALALCRSAAEGDQGDAPPRTREHRAKLVVVAPKSGPRPMSRV